MKAVVQRVKRASVDVGGETIGAIDAGLLIYLGVGRGDGDEDLDWTVDKIARARVFTNDAGKMDKSVVDIGGSLLVVSQFTLYGDLTRGRRPSFDAAMPPDEARACYEAFLRRAAALAPVCAGRFGADMQVHSINDGPVTILLDSRQR